MVLKNAQRQSFFCKYRRNSMVKIRRSTGIISRASFCMLKSAKHYSLCYRPYLKRLPVPAPSRFAPLAAFSTFPPVRAAAFFPPFIAGPPVRLPFRCPVFPTCLAPSNKRHFRKPSALRASFHASISSYNFLLNIRNTPLSYTIPKIPEIPAFVKPCA